MKKKAQIDQSHCVACGSCISVCPLSAIHVEKGLYAVVNHDRCVGCGRCKQICPASVIAIEVTE